jgi:hypothetical protein
MRKTCRAVGVLSLVAVVGCHSSEPRRAGGTGSQTNAAVANTVAATAAPTPRPAATLTGRPPQESAARQLSNRMTINAWRAPRGRDALIQFGVLGGTLAAAPGLAEMTAHVLAEGGDPSQGRPGLRLAIARLGGSLDVHPGPISTWLDIRVPGDRWMDAVTALRAAVDEPPQSRGQIERLRERFVTERTRTIERDPVEIMAHRLMLGDRSTVEHVNELLDRDPSEVSTFVSRVYRPDQAVLAIETGEDPTKVLDFVSRQGREGFGGWQPRSALPGTVKLLDRAFPPGVHWSPGAANGPCQVAIVAMLPAVWAVDAPQLLILQDCVTLDGTGGRFEKLQQQRDLGHIRWHSEITQTPDAAALVLRTEANPQEALALWQLFNLARASLRDAPPTQSELDLARRRAPLTGRLAALDPGARLRHQVQAQLRQHGFAQLDAAFAQVDVRGFDAKVAATEFLKLPTAMVVVGGRIPDGNPEVQTFQLLPAERPTVPVQAPTAAESPADTGGNANPWLERAVRAVGGQANLARLDGWTHEARLSHAEAPAAEERVTFRSRGDLQRTRTLLTIQIETTIAGDDATERIAPVTRTLAPDAVVQLRREQQRHPLALLAAFSRGELQFRAVGQRTVGDREYMVVEATGAMFDRLWLWIDIQSALPRIVESWEPFSDGSTLHQQDAWSDYRTIEGLRVPFHRLTTQNEGQNRLEVTYQQWRPARRDS